MICSVTKLDLIRHGSMHWCVLLENLDFELHRLHTMNLSPRFMSAYIMLTTCYSASNLKASATVWQWSGFHGARPGCVWAWELHRCRVSWRGSGQGCQWSPRPLGRRLFCGREQAPCDLDPGPQLEVDNSKQSGFLEKQCDASERKSLRY